jgi:hypothetical protein
MSKFHQRGEQYVAKHKLGSLDEEYLNREEMAAARKAIMNYKLKDSGPSVYRRKKK